MRRKKQEKKKNKEIRLSFAFKQNKIGYLPSGLLIPIPKAMVAL